MKYLFLMIGLCISSAVVASEPVTLDDLGLTGMVEVSESAGMKVRGLASLTRTSSFSDLAVTVYDKATGSQFNIASTSFQASDGDNQAEGTIGGSESIVGTSAIDLTIGSFRFMQAPSLAFGGAIGAANTTARFQLTNGILP